jgi:hypothetical protein
VRYRAVGTINGAGSYGFELQVSGGATDDVDLTTILEGGNPTIHKFK